MKLVNIIQIRQNVVNYTMLLKYRVTALLV